MTVQRVHRVTVSSKLSNTAQIKSPNYGRIRFARGTSIERRRGEGPRGAGAGSPDGKLGDPSTIVVESRLTSQGQTMFRNRESGNYEQYRTVMALFICFCSIFCRVTFVFPRETKKMKTAEKILSVAFRLKLCDHYLRLSFVPGVIHPIPADKVFISITSRPAVKKHFKITADQERAGGLVKGVQHGATANLHKVKDEGHRRSRISLSQ